MLSEMGGLARRMPVVAGAFVVAVASIAGVPPTNGYVSVSLIHKAMLDNGRVGLFAALVAAQIITIAALGRAAWLAFFRRREQPYEGLEPLKPGMLTGFASLGLCCVAFGVVPKFFLEHVMAPAASSLLHPARYVGAILARAGSVPRLNIAFDYVDPGQFIEVAATVAAGAALAFWYLRTREPAPVRALRALHNGSANDYTAYAVAGILMLITVLTIA
jgi:multicomponent Na+:H+ antiporter subunit D